MIYYMLYIVLDNLKDPTTKKKKRKKKDCSRTKQPQLNLIITGYVKVRMEKPMQTQLMNKEN